MLFVSQNGYKYLLTAFWHLHFQGRQFGKSKLKQKTNLNFKA